MKIFISVLEHNNRIMFYFLLSLIFSINLINCNHVEVENRTPEFPVKKCYEYDSKKTVDNVCMALLLIQEEHEIDKYFGHSLYSANILPILIVTENTNKDSSFILPAEEPKIYLFKPDEIKKGIPTQNSSETTANIDAKKSIYEYGGIRLKDSKNERIGQAIAGGIIGGGVVGGVILEVLWVDPGEDIRTSTYNVTRKSLRKETLSPLETESGFIFVNLPNDIDDNQKLIVNISVINMKSGKKSKFEFIENLTK